MRHRLRRLAALTTPDHRSLWALQALGRGPSATRGALAISTSYATGLLRSPVLSGCAGLEVIAEHGAQGSAIGGDDIRLWTHRAAAAEAWAMGIGSGRTAGVQCSHARPAHSPLRYCRDRERKLAL